MAELQGSQRSPGQQAASPRAAGWEAQHPIARAGESWVVYRIMDFQVLIQYRYTQ